ncbi:MULTISPECIES: protein-export chaperone SecB [unclassified Cupriavidus]|uniref:protein-export chaperone SecB n=1 Tax=unclassified Cupriavidus TaxID=2640874 RepID=UPI00313EDD9C
MANSENQGSGQQPWPLHAIQLVDLRVEHLSITAHVEVDRSEEPGAFSFETASNEYDPEESQIRVRARIRIGLTDEAEDDSDLGEPDPEAPYVMVVSLVGIFQVDAERFPIEHIDHWAKRNAPLILYPYLREHALSLSVRAGFPQMLLPLLEMPSFRILPPAKASENKVQ